MHCIWANCPRCRLYRTLISELFLGNAGDVSGQPIGPFLLGLLDPWKMEPIGCSEGITTIRSVISQKIADLIYFVAKALKRV